MDQYREKLGIKISLYNTCLFITKNSSENFSIARLQINNTLNFKIEAFIKKEETEIMEAEFKAKTETILETNISRDFDSCHITIEVGSIMVVRKNQAEKLVFVDIKDNAKK